MEIVSKNFELKPAIGCLVADKNNDIARVKRVELFDERKHRTLIKYLNQNREYWIDWNELTSGLREGNNVEHIPSSPTQSSLGTGTVLSLRNIAGIEQALVEFPKSGEILWLPHERLVRVPSAKKHFDIKNRILSGDPERLRLRTLNQALLNWNENTGSLSRLDVDPLPHQIYLVHHILRSGNLNWLIADDVGLGKTIEIGLLISALKQRKSLKRVLVISPAGLVRQWKEEMRDRFGFRDFEIYGSDFEIDSKYLEDWAKHTHVIGSIDKLKKEEQKKILLGAGDWDLIVFDEAHRLSRRQFGINYKRTERYQLAKDLRDKTESLILLSATPHQGMQDKFQALLELIRPELKRRILALGQNQEILNEMLFRNAKSEVIDLQGNLIFKGKDAFAVQVKVSESEKGFDKSLRQYLVRGYDAGKSGGKTGRAIGFVMTVYRKLAASSFAAIEQALERRLDRLTKDKSVPETNLDYESLEEADERFLGEWEEKIITNKKEFFEGEIKQLKELIDFAKHLKSSDTKIDVLLNDILIPQIQENPKEKFVIFTEYRATQDFILKELSAHFGNESCEFICGSQSFKEREEAIYKFNSEANFLVSTEAGGEGINLQKHCHMMVNFDLPWNPMRMVQRIGRLYRYGQNRRVKVFNLQSPQTFDSAILDLMYQRIATVSRDMSTVGKEFREGLADEILGEISEAIDIQTLLEQSSDFDRVRTDAEIEKALNEAKLAVNLQREIFSSAASFHKDDIAEGFKINQSHLEAFLNGCCKHFGIQIVEKTQSDKVWHLRLPEKLLEDAQGVSKINFKLTAHRDLANRYSGIDMFDFSHPLLNYFSKEIQKTEFRGHCSYAKIPNAKAIVTAIVRWQSEKGKRLREEFVVYQLNHNGSFIKNPISFSKWLLQENSNDIPANDCEITKLAPLFQQKLAEFQKSRCTSRLHPENIEWITAIRSE